jgi:hypothetical protein
MKSPFVTYIQKHYEIKTDDPDDMSTDDPYGIIVVFWDFFCCSES